MGLAPLDLIVWDMMAPSARAVPRQTLLISATVLLSGCSTASAPAVIVLGAYFPAWLILAILSILFAVAARVALAIAGRIDVLPYPLFTCLACGILAAGMFDLLWLDR